VPVSVFSVVVGLWCVILVLFGGMCISRLGEVCISWRGVHKFGIGTCAVASVWVWASVFVGCAVL